MVSTLLFARLMLCRARSMKTPESMTQARLRASYLATEETLYGIRSSASANRQLLRHIALAPSDEMLGMEILDALHEIPRKPPPVAPVDVAPLTPHSVNVPHPAVDMMESRGLTDTTDAEEGVTHRHRAKSKLCTFCSLRGHTVDKCHTKRQIIKRAAEAEALRINEDASLHGPPTDTSRFQSTG